MYIKCTCTDGNYFTEGRKYYVVDFLKDGGYMVSDNDGKDHYLSGEYAEKHFETWEELMTITERQHKENGYYISLDWSKENIWIVQACPCYDDNKCGYPIAEMRYPNTQKERRKAEATFRRYVKKYCKGE